MKFACAFLLLYAWHMLGISIGYHRILSHRAARCPKLIEYFFVLGGYLALEGSPMTWAVIHRQHHRYPDQKDDPHSPSAGLWDSYIGWMLRFRYAKDVNPEKLTKDLLSDPIYRLLDAGGHLYVAYGACVVVCVLFRLLLWHCFGAKVVLASIAAGLVSQQLPLILNVMAHVPNRGYRNFDTRDTSVNIGWLAWLTAGEGWHNNHHAAPSAANFSVRPTEVDLSHLVLKMLKRARLATLRRRTSAPTARDIAA